MKQPASRPANEGMALWRQAAKERVAELRELNGGPDKCSIVYNPNDHMGEPTTIEEAREMARVTIRVTLIHA